MKIQRTIPPSAPPLRLVNFSHSLRGLFGGHNYLKELENSLREHFGAKHIFLVSSGKAALTLILEAIKALSPEKQKVLIPAYTCFSVPSAIVKAGLDVSLCDIDPPTLDFDYCQLEKAIDNSTLCVIPSHLFGIPSDMDRVIALAKAKGVYIVEDAAQAMGGSYNGRLLGGIGDVGFFSLGRGKNISCGSGGIIITNSDMIASEIYNRYTLLQTITRAESLRTLLGLALMAIFIHPMLYWFPAGLSFLGLGQTVFHKDFPIKKLSDSKAGLLKNWRSLLEQSNLTRKETAAWFIKKMQLNSSYSDAIPYLRLPLLLDSREERDRLFALSQRSGLGLSPMYPTSVNTIEEIQEMVIDQTFPAAATVADRLLTIPTHHLLSEEDKMRILNVLNTSRSGGQHMEKQAQ